MKDKLVEKIADYLEQYSKDVRELDRNPSRWECENAAAELKDNLLSDTNIIEIDPDAGLPKNPITDEMMNRSGEEGEYYIGRHNGIWKKEKK